MPFQLPVSVKGFHDYFKLTAVSQEVIAAFGYGFATELLNLPQSATEMLWLPTLQSRLEFALRKFAFTSESARREFLIAPLLFEIALHEDVEIRTEYSIFVSSQLKGSLDYYLRANRNVLIIEAKHADLVRGFTQLAAELIALDQWTDSDADVLYGAVSVGDIWRFAQLHRADKQLTQDLRTYSLPVETENVVRILVALLQPRL